MSFLVIANQQQLWGAGRSLAPQSSLPDRHNRSATFDLMLLNVRMLFEK